MLTCKDVSCITQESLQQCELHAGQVDRHVVQPDFTRSRLEAEIAHDQCGNRTCGSDGTAQDGANTSDKLARVEWLGNVVVSADLQAQDSLDVLSARGQDQHW